MESYDNEWVLMLDDDLFVVEGERECIKNTIQIQQEEKSETAQ